MCLKEDEAPDINYSLSSKSEEESAVSVRMCAGIIIVWDIWHHPPSKAI